MMKDMRTGNKCDGFGTKNRGRRDGRSFEGEAEREAEERARQEGECAAEEIPATTTKKVYIS